MKMDVKENQVEAMVSVWASRSASRLFGYGRLKLSWKWNLNQWCRGGDRSETITKEDRSSENEVTCLIVICVKNVVMVIWWCRKNFYSETLWTILSLFWWWPSKWVVNSNHWAFYAYVKSTLIVKINYNAATDHIRYRRQFLLLSTILNLFW